MEKKESNFFFFFQGKIHRWDASAEDECEPFANIVQRVRILFCTPQSLCNYLVEQAKMKVSLNDFSLIVLDECHHTIGKGPFNEIMSYYRRHKYGPQSNRIPQVFLWNLHKIKNSPQSNRIPPIFYSNLHKIKTSPQSNCIPQVFHWNWYKIKTSPQSNRIPQVFHWNLYKIKTSPQSNRIPQVFHWNLYKIKTSPQSNRIPQVWQMSFKFT
jgi:hypothetical protein